MNSAEEEDFSEVFVLACISHVMKNAKDDLKRLFGNKVYQYGMYCMSVLVKSTSLDQVEKCLFCIKILFCSPQLTKELLIHTNSLCNMIGSLGCLNDSDSIVNDVFKSDVTSKRMKKITQRMKKFT